MITKKVRTRRQLMLAIFPSRLGSYGGHQMINDGVEMRLIKSTTIEPIPEMIIEFL